ncbi:MAG TPA: class I SAM-dependent methyltransferase [Candidatus Acidoferrales bacterium]|nr:class I SAM-dependent methyltransferase [Candidatus Acidoferrales bacterium]
MAILVTGFVAALLVLRADLRRRRLSFRRTAGWHVLSALDVLCPALTAAMAAMLLAAVIASSRGTLPFFSAEVRGALAGALIGLFLWGEGRRQIQFQRPLGIVLGEWLVLGGAWGLLESYGFGGLRSISHLAAVRLLFILMTVSGTAMIAVIVASFLKGEEVRLILDRVAEQGDSLQEEYTPPTPECPHPERWRMLDSKSSEVEVIEFLKSLVVTVKPQLIVETGTFLGYSTLKMAEGLKRNGFGRIVTLEYDPEIFARAKERIAASGLGRWIECRNESSLETRIEGTIDLLFSDSLMAIREQEIRRFLPQINLWGLILIHDASSHFHVVREAALRLEKEGLLSVALLPTPRGLVIAQKREGRK